MLLKPQRALFHQLLYYILGWRFISREHSPLCDQDLNSKTNLRNSPHFCGCLFKHKQGHFFFNILRSATLKADKQFQINNKITRQYLISLTFFFSLKALRWRRQRLCSFCIYPSLQNVSILTDVLHFKWYFY